MIRSKTAIFFIGIACITLLGATLVEKPFTDTFWQEADSLHMTFPLDATYAAYEVTYFKWESDLDTTYNYRLSIYTDKQKETIVLDSIYNPYEILTPRHGSEERDTLVQIIPAENRIDLNHLLIGDHSYFWTLKAYNNGDSITRTGSFITENTGVRVDYHKTDSLTERIDCYTQNLYFLNVEEHGNIQDLNVRISYDSRENYILEGDLSPEILLSHPDGTQMTLSHSADGSNMNHEKIYDDQAFLSIEEFYQGRFYSVFIDVEEDGTGLFDYRARPSDSLNIFNNKDAYGKWILEVLFDDELNFKIGSSNIQLEFELESFPIESEVISWSRDQVTLEWAAKEGVTVTALQKKIAPAGSFQSIPGFTNTSDTFIDPFQNHGEKINYRYTGVSADGQQVYSNEILVHSPLLPFLHDSTKIAAKFMYACDYYDYIGWTINWLSQPINASGYFITTDTLDQQDLLIRLPEIVEQPEFGTVYFKAFNQYDTTKWHAVSEQFEVISLEGEFEVGDISDDSLTFRWSTNLQGSADFSLLQAGIFGGYGDVIEDRHAQLQDESITIYSQHLEWVNRPGEYRWLIGEYRHPFRHTFGYKDFIIKENFSSDYLLEPTYPIRKNYGRAQLSADTLSFRWETDYEQKIDFHLWEMTDDPTMPRVLLYTEQSNAGEVTLFESDLEWTKKLGNYQWTLGRPDTSWRTTSLSVLDPSLILETEIETYVNIFPNPTQRFLEIENPEIIEYCAVTDFSGKKIQEYQPYSSTIKLDFHSFTSGVYLIQIKTKSNSKFLRIIKE